MGRERAGTRYPDACDSVVAPAERTRPPDRCGSERSLETRETVLSLSSSSPSLRERLERPASRRRRELDACGIGFVADEQGRASREVVEMALVGLSCVRHRGAVAADGLSGDGAGVLLPTPPAFLARAAAELGADVPVDRLGIVFAFLDLHDERARATAQDAVELGPGHC